MAICMAPLMVAIHQNLRSSEKIMREQQERRMAKKEKSEWTVCGRAIGTASGWDQSDTFSMMLYGFEPVDGYRGPSGDVLFRFENGTIESFKRDGSVKASCDLIDAIKDLPVSRTD